MTDRGPVRPRGSRDGATGSKARNLQWLADRGVMVPEFRIISNLEDPNGLDFDDGLYAVRSSAEAEDGAERAFAGEFLTVLDVAADRVPEEVQRVREAMGDHDGSVIVQRMVSPVLSGVAFSRHPVTGLSDVVVEALEGRGDDLLEHGNEPLRWVFRHGEAIEGPGNGGRHETLVEEVVATTTRLASRFGPADVEWVWDGTRLWWVQIRPITAIEDVPIYSRRIAKDVLPGLIKPLVWSINVPVVNAAWIRLFTQAIGPNDLDPRSLARSFAFRAYFDMRAIGDIFELVGMPRDSLENLLGLPGAGGRMRPGLGAVAKTPRLLILAWRLGTGGSRLGRDRVRLQTEVDERAAMDPTAMSDEALVASVAELSDLIGRAAYLNIVVPLVASVHVRRFTSGLERRGLSLDDVEPFPRGPYDPIPDISRLAESLRAMDDDRLAAALAGDLDALDSESARVLEEVLERHGHQSESSNDLSVPRWRDVPHTVVRLAYDANDSGAPGASGRAWAELGRRMERRWRRVASHVLKREAAGSTFVHAYGLLRPVVLEIGRRLVGRGKAGAADDVFYVDIDRVLSAFTGEGDIIGEAEATRRELDLVSDLDMPDLIVGDRWLPESRAVGDRLRGVGVSRGRYRGTARFVGSLADSSLLEPGEVLVVERSDVAWTPLFTRAGGVVSSVGGILAHAAITARELGIPCVSSVDGARSLDGRQVLIDGFTGEILIEG